MEIIEPITAILLWITLGIIVYLFSKTKDSNNKITIKKVIMNILTFILFVVVYYIVICIISLVPLSMISSSSNSNTDSGLWAYSIMLGLGFAPILSLITTIRLNKKQNNTIKKTIIIISIVIVSFIGIGIILSTILNLKTLRTEYTYEDEDAYEYTYNFTYYGGLIDRSKYDISIKGNNIDIIETSLSSDINCIPITSTKTFNYSEENLEKLKSFINNNFPKEYTILNDNELTERQTEVIEGLLVGEYSFETSVEDYKYKIVYLPNNDFTHFIYFKNDNSILVKKIKDNNDYNSANVETYPLDFTKESLNILNDYINKEIKTENSDVIYKLGTLKDDEINIFKSIVEKDESFLNNMESKAN